MNRWLKFVFILLGGFVFYLLTGDLSEAVLLSIILSYIEFRIIDKKSKDK